MIKMEAAQAAVEAYVDQFPDGDAEHTDPIETQISDLLADLFHLAAAESLNPDVLIERALMHFYAEQAEGPPWPPTR
ncbi:hypothetical protein Snoj_04340 [Streptomyces nojiriensis]|uniref:NTP pyrophosphohydrolase MazG putative catalytic core domain-containing protein n=1 Tax=Streptomyces nojiriensis TaxID=66374 RepID=A0ABQ3SEF4_9ACTN|nr:hypothetical protein [Streptomyces nojiriensis]QTI48167.1 hypothetical protein JYK04_06027 [Streptomyces nojiriensis]GGS25844.1 hypothetical protein GCM10010205_64810 [Streptomyces nojiriensis]GHI66516.1 hypothetical protein Snoj_04340 [Streptomyces nojiriensis]